MVNCTAQMKLQKKGKSVFLYMFLFLHNSGWESDQLVNHISLWPHPNFVSLQNLNFTGFRKILKKHDKILETSRGADWRVGHVEVAPFYTCKKITQLISETEVKTHTLAHTCSFVHIDCINFVLCSAGIGHHRVRRRW